MIYEVMKEVRNFFVKSRHYGDYSIVNGELNLPFMVDNQLFLIEGSILNDGVYKYPCTTLMDEAFNGCISALSVPPTFIALCDKIAEYEQNTQPSAYTSESFGGYSYTKATDSSGNPLTWQGVFKNDLKRWRKI